MNKKRKGFTLAEIIIVLAIVGFIIFTSLQVYKVNKTAYTALAYYAHKNIKEMVAEMMADAALTHITPGEEVSRLVNDDNRKIYEKLLFENNAEDVAFIQRMINIANTQGPTNSAPNNWNFTATNGQRYYVSGHQTDPDIGDYGFRIIKVDLNGTSGPNSEEGANPDIISFRVFDDGEVFPWGDWAENQKYLRAKLKGFNFNDDNTRDEGIIPINCKKAEDGSDLTGANKTCNYGAQNVENGAGTGNYVFTYKQAYCNTVKLETGLTESIQHLYCNNVNLEDKCPPSPPGTLDAFDKCSIELIKPMFRFSFG